MEFDPAKKSEGDSGEKINDGGLSKMPSYEEFDKMRAQGNLLDGVRDEQDYHEYIEERSAHENEARVAEEEKFSQEDTRIESVMAEMEDEDARIEMGFALPIDGYNWRDKVRDGRNLIERRTEEKFAIWQLAKTVAESYNTPNLSQFEKGNLEMKFGALAKLWTGEASLRDQKMDAVIRLTDETPDFIRDEDAPLSNDARSCVRQLQCIEDVTKELIPFKREYEYYEKRQKEKAETQ